jgi:hypothetical protein
MTSQGKFILTMVLILVFCLLLFFLSGLIHVKKNHLIVVGKHARYQSLLAEGWHYRLPFLYEVSAPYPVNPESFLISLKGGRKAKGRYVVKDPQAYFEGHLSLRHVLKDLAKESKDAPTLVKESTQVMLTLGVEVSELTIIER